MKLLSQLRRKIRYLLWPTVFIAVAVPLKATLFAPPSVTAVKVENRDLTAQVYGNGTVEAKVVVGISSKITGRIVELHVDQGDYVKQGQLLAKLESEDLTEQVRQAEANVLRAKATQNVETANVQKALANLELAERDARRFKNLAEKDFVPRQQAEQYDIAHRVAREELNHSRASLEQARMDEAANRATQRYARSKLQDTMIYAPQDGLIISRDLELGAIVTPGQTIFTFTDPRVVWVKANVDESQMKGVGVGRKAIVTLRSAQGERIDGQVARIGHQSDRVTEESEVDVAYTPSLDTLRLGEQADVYITTETKKVTPSLPSAAIVSKGKKRGVWLIENGTLRFKEVVPGIVDRRNFTEILSGLGAGDTVAMAEPQEMAKFEDGRQARVIQ